MRRLNMPRFPRFRMPEKGTLLKIAEIIDAFRIVPRMVLLCYGYFVFYVTEWFMLLPIPTTQQAGLVTAVVGIAAVVVGLYQQSGRIWSRLGARQEVLRRNAQAPVVYTLDSHGGGGGRGGYYNDRGRGRGRYREEDERSINKSYKDEEKDIGEGPEIGEGPGPKYSDEGGE